jgi:hypothetical protein
MNTRSTIRIATLLLIATAATMGGTAFAATTAKAKPKSTAKHAAKPAAAAPVAPVDTAPPVVSGSHWMTPHEVMLRTTTPVEARANAVWNLRAALNIAALQCQYLPQLGTVQIYNTMLRQHAAELDRARLTMIGHFKRYDGARAQNSFDQYTTKTYNSYSTLDAQKAFCEATAKAGKEVLELPTGGLSEAATRLVPDIRFALAEPVKPAPIDAPAATPDPIVPPAQ